MDADITIIGAGVIGLAIASELAESNLSLYILEKNETHGMGISSRNSEVIHAGIYYPPGSLKAQLCVEGREILYETCVKNSIPHMKRGKLIIATTEKEMGKVERLMHNALHNGVSSVSLLTQSEIRQKEPNIKAFGALYSPDTGILSAHSLMDYYLCSAKRKGAEIVYGTQVVGIERDTAGYRIVTLNRDGEYFEFISERVINAAGLQSDIIARMVGKDYTLHYCKGDYFSINAAKRGLVQRLVYPVPEENHVGLGVHLTLDLQGRMKLGPDATYTDKVEEYRVDASKRDLFYESAVRFLPFIRKGDIVPDMSGIRPKLQGYGKGFHDFVISEDLPGFINLVGIESPGLTAAPAIARHVKRILKSVSSH
ncbi:MAG: NAD(P)/FAD-dependent oxidoreductase [Nitrospirae bacterium]|nr:NAD(P)/FAD-dependent oxidoreductase [Nitrospirota bacterium]